MLVAPKHRSFKTSVQACGHSVLEAARLGSMVSIKRPVPKDSRRYLRLKIAPYARFNDLLLPGPK
ncbi:MAG: hypothetical protein Q9204_003279, partial [Flavoplaca sp. TL-2023a]